ncbi:hypothetical protein H9P43_008393 [Blastocladiella emersonii ATCC 22665]|nr:hypothetical protein H9P43_008393 [Blastocladiella emersonii ATCC 22665]
MFAWPSSTATPPPARTALPITPSATPPPPPSDDTAPAPASPSSSEPLAATLDAVAEALQAITANSGAAGVAIEDDFEVIDFGGCDGSGSGTTSALDGRVDRLVSAVTQLTAILQAERAETGGGASGRGTKRGGGGGRLQPLRTRTSTGGSHDSAAVTPGTFPASPKPGPRGTGADSLTDDEDNEDPGTSSEWVHLPPHVRRLEQRVVRLESVLTHALAAVRALHTTSAGGAAAPFQHTVLVRDLHQWGTSCVLTSPNATVGDLKKMIAGQLGDGRAPHQLRLVWAGTVLCDDNAFACTAIPQNGVAILMGSTRG